VAVVGCTHGQLDVIYSKVEQIELSEGIKVDLVLCCGDFEVYFLSSLLLSSSFRPDPV
jgi:predicted phosphodiesterase